MFQTSGIVDRHARETRAAPRPRRREEGKKRVKTGGGEKASVASAEAVYTMKKGEQPALISWFCH